VGGWGLAEAMTSHRNDCSPFWTEGSPVWRALPTSRHLVHPLTLICLLGDGVIIKVHENTHFFCVFCHCWSPV